MKFGINIFMYANKTKFLIVFIICGLCLVLSCNQDLNSALQSVNENSKIQNERTDRVEVIQKINNELETNRMLWEKQKISSYNFIASIIEEGGSSIGEVLIKVRDEECISIESNIKDRYDTVISGNIDKYKEFSSVKSMFITIQSNIDKGVLTKVEFNRKFGYPEKIFLNPYPKSNYYFAFTVKKLEIVNN